jgi:rhamnose transport system permease protein
MNSVANPVAKPAVALRAPALWVNWEVLIASLTLSVLAYAALAVPNFLSGFNISQAAAGIAEKALLVLPMVLLIIAREIDLSVASTLALCSVVLGLLIQAQLPLGLAIVLVLLVGAAAGALNGWMVASLGLPSLVVTLGTMALYRGAGYILLGSRSVNELPQSLTDFGLDSIGATFVPWTLLPFLLLAPVFAVVLHRTATGRRIFVLGGNPDAALYSGIHVKRLRWLLFTVSGVVAAIAAVVYTARLSNARADNALGFELDVITIVFLGGVSVFGGSGRLGGVVWALVLVAALRNVLGLNQVSGAAQGLVIGGLLIASLLLSNTLNAALERLRLQQLRKAVPGI